MIKKIEHGDVSQVSGGMLQQVVIFPSKSGDVKSVPGKDEKRYVIADPLFPKQLLENRSYPGVEFLRRALICAKMDYLKVLLTVNI